MLFQNFQIIFLIFVASAGNPCQGWAFGKTAHKDFYAKCAGGVPGITCSGIPEGCVGRIDCILGVSFWENESHFWGKIITPQSVDHFEPYAVVLGYAPFEKEGSNLTAKCKPKLVLKDFRIIFYKLHPNEIPQAGHKSILTSGEQGFGKTEDAWGHNCAHTFETANGFYNDIYARMKLKHERFIILEGEYVHLEYAGFPDDMDPRFGELPGFKDGAQYQSKDGITYTNF